MEERKCLRCGSAMEKGAVSVLTLGASQPQWSPEKPKPASFWSFTPRYQIVVFRCVECGMLESVATPP